MTMSASGDGADSSSWQGVFAILCTPFKADGGLDLASLEREIQFCLDARAHGIVALVNASEYWTLSDDERRQVAALTIKRVSGSVPVVIGITAGSAHWAANFAQHAQDNGADAVIAMPPTGRPANELECFRYYEKLTSVLRIPLFVQNHDAPLGTRMSASLVSRIVRELPHADWVKEETVPAGHAISAEIAACGQKLRGIMGGMAGRYLFDEFARGSCGTMPACESVDIHVRIWEHLASGETDKARETFMQLLPLLNYEAISAGIYKTVLQWRGVIDSNYLRTNLGNPLDTYDLRELAIIVRGLRHLLEVAPLREELLDAATEGAL
jgi:dihydrodipicolinate synthase/N-acetylneuraminate lyase